MSQKILVVKEKALKNWPASTCTAIEPEARVRSVPLARAFCSLAASARFRQCSHVVHLTKVLLWLLILGDSGVGKSKARRVQRARPRLRPRWPPARVSLCASFFARRSHARRVDLSP